MTSTTTGKSRAARILLVALAIMILLGVALTVYFLTVDKRVIKVRIEPDETQQIHFDAICLRPGEQCEYTVELSCEYSKQYRLTLAFSDREPTQTLKNYAHVRVEKDGEVVCDQLLADMFEQGGVTTQIDFTDGAKNDIRIVFYMLETVGNEAQNAEADFDLLLTATNK